MFSYIFLKSTWFTSIEVDSKVRRIYFRDCWFLESKSEIDLKKIYAVSKYVVYYSDWGDFWA